MMVTVALVAFAAIFLTPIAAVTIRLLPNAFAFGVSSSSERNKVETQELLQRSYGFNSHYAKPDSESEDTKYASLVNLLNKLRHDHNTRKGDTVRIYRISNPEVLQEYRDRHLEDDLSRHSATERACKCGLDKNEDQEVDGDMIRLTNDDRSRCNCVGSNMLDLTLRSLLKAARRTNEKLHQKDVKTKHVGAGENGNIGWGEYDDAPKKSNGRYDIFDRPRKSKSHAENFGSLKKSKGNFANFNSPKKSKGKNDDYNDAPTKSKGNLDDIYYQKKSKGKIDDYDTPKQSRGNLDDLDIPKKSKGSLDDYDPPKKSRGKTNDYDDITKKFKGNINDYDTPKKSKGKIVDFDFPEKSKGNHADFEMPKGLKSAPSITDWRHLVQQETAEKKHVKSNFRVEPAAPSKVSASEWGSYKNLKIPSADRWAGVGVNSNPRPVARPQLRYRPAENLRQRGGGGGYGGGGGGFGRTSIPMPGKKRLYDDE